MPSFLGRECLFLVPAGMAPIMCPSLRAGPSEAGEAFPESRRPQVAFLFLPLLTACEDFVQNDIRIRCQEKEEAPHMHYLGIAIQI